MGQTLTNGIYLPAEGERNCYEGLAANWTALDGMIGGYNVHISNTTIHVTAADKEAWNGKADASALTAHTGDTSIHVTAEDKAAWNGKADASALTAHTGNTTIHVTAADKQAWNGKADASALTAHTGNTTIHVTAADKEAWNGKQDALSQTQLDAVNSGIDATKVQQIATNTSGISSLQSGKANDSDVLHKSGNESSSGNKIFEGEIISASNIVVSPDSTYVTGIKDKKLIDKNLFNILSERITYTNSRNIRYSWTISNKDSNGNTISSGLQLALAAAGQAYFYPINDNDIFFGASTAYIRGIYTKLINSLTPSSLSLPNYPVGKVDISAYITDLSGANNNFTAPANGYVFIRTGNGTYLKLLEYPSGACSSVCSQTADDIGTFIPVLSGRVCIIAVKCSSIDRAYFIPCQGNI